MPARIPSRRLPPVQQLRAIMAILRSPEGCPWDRQQSHRSLRPHAIEEVYELFDAIASRDDDALAEELGDLLLQVVFHCQLAEERGAFDFDHVARVITDKLLRRHPHVFGDVKVKDVAEVWANWEEIKRAEKTGTRHHRPSALDGIPKHLPALARVEKLTRKARKAGLLEDVPLPSRMPKAELARLIYGAAAHAQSLGWSAEELVMDEARRHERMYRQRERKRAKTR